MATNQDNQDFALLPPGGKEPAAPAGLCTRRELAERFGVHMMTITKWERDAMPVAINGGPGRASYYDEAKVKEWLDRRAAVAQTATGDRLDANKARASRDFWQAQLAEQQHQTRARVLVHVDDVEKAWTAELSGLRAAILSTVPGAADRLHRVAQLEGVAGVFRELKALAHELLRELSDPNRPIADLPDRAPAAPPFTDAEPAVPIDDPAPLTDEDIIEEASS